MRTPRVNPIGLVEYPEGFEAMGRRYSAGTRVLAVVVMFVFAYVTITTTVASLGAYCLTSQ